MGIVILAIDMMQFLLFLLLIIFITISEELVSVLISRLSFFDDIYH